MRNSIYTKLVMKLLLRSRTRSLLSDMRDSGNILSELSRSSNTSNFDNLQHRQTEFNFRQSNASSCDSALEITKTLLLLFSSL